jgi:hypothetical protein
MGWSLRSRAVIFNYIFAMRLWSLAGAQDGPLYAGGFVGGFAGSLVPIATWLNPHSTTGLAVEVSKFFNMGMSVEDAYRVQGSN